MNVLVIDSGVRFGVERNLPIYMEHIAGKIWQVNEDGWSDVSLEEVN